MSTTETTEGTAYQWSFNGEDLDGATSATYPIPFNRSLEGTYVCTMTNSNVPGLTIIRAPYELSDAINDAPIAGDDIDTLDPK